MESRGVDFDDPADVSAESIRKRWKHIANMRGALVFADALKAVGVTFDTLRQRVAHAGSRPSVSDPD
jgi:hypothetical protein